LTVEVSQNERAQGQREAEAEAVAEICQRLIGAIDIERQDGTRSRLRPGDIALLAPTGTDLWRYERALEAKRIAVASQAGKTLFLRQETQDVLALLRTLADPRDTLAFGALMRGPLVGLTDNELLEITSALSDGERGSNFTVLTEPERVTHPLARTVLETLQRLRRRAGITTPALLLSQAIEELQVRVVLTARHRNRSARAITNVDALTERAQPYGVSGLQAFVHDLQRDWEQKSRVSK
jgi:ATP-dependent exoDNAse (exonuclease V) beta subunit